MDKAAVGAYGVRRTMVARDEGGRSTPLHAGRGRSPPIPTNSSIFIIAALQDAILIMKEHEDHGSTANCKTRPLLPAAT